jgi:hypothetical protein
VQRSGLLRSCPCALYNAELLPRATGAPCNWRCRDHNGAAAFSGHARGHARAHHCALSHGALLLIAAKSAVARLASSAAAGSPAIVVLDAHNDTTYYCTESNPGYVGAVRTSTMTALGSVQLLSSETLLRALWLDAAGSELYVGSTTTPAYVIQLAVPYGGGVRTRVGAVALPGTTVSPQALVGSSDFVFAACNGIAKLSRSPFAVVATTATTSAEGGVYPLALDQQRGVLVGIAGCYAATPGTAIAYDPDTLQRLDTVTRQTGEADVRGAYAYDYDAGVMYAATYGDPCVVVKVGAAPLRRIAALSLDAAAGERQCHAAFIGRESQTLYVLARPDASTIRLVSIDLTAFSRIGATSASADGNIRSAAVDDARGYATLAVQSGTDALILLQLRPALADVAAFSATPSPTATATTSLSSTASATATSSCSGSASDTPTQSSTSSPSATASASGTFTGSASQSASSSASASITALPTNTASATSTTSAAQLVSASTTQSPSATTTPSSSSTSQALKPATQSASNSASPTPTGSTASLLAAGAGAGAADEPGPPPSYVIVLAAVLAVGALALVVILLWLFRKGAVKGARCGCGAQARAPRPSGRRQDSVLSYISNPIENIHKTHHSGRGPRQPQSQANALRAVSWGCDSDEGSSTPYTSQVISGGAAASRSKARVSYAPVTTARAKDPSPNRSLSAAKELTASANPPAWAAIASAHAIGFVAHSPPMHA